MGWGVGGVLLLNACIKLNKRERQLVTCKEVTANFLTVEGGDISRMRWGMVRVGGITRTGWGE